MTDRRFFTPLKIGLFTVTASYFLFALHDAFTLSWIGEWNRLGGPGHFIFEVYVEDIVGDVFGGSFRLAAGIIAFAAIIYYFYKRNISKPAVFKILRAIIALEGLYWLMIFSAGYFETRDLFFTGTFAHSSVSVVLNSFALNDLPVLVESIVLPIFLFILAYKLNPNKPLRGQIQWALITGTIYVFVFWLLESTIWISVVQTKGWGYLTSYPQNLLSYVLSVFGLLALAIYAVGFSLKSRRAETLQELNLKIVGVIILALGLYFLWNYLTWIYFGGWSNWYAWFMGHNEDLWILALPMLGLPLLFVNKPEQKNHSS